jgi:predicted DNA-binding transcriptional regulator AlpA
MPRKKPIDETAQALRKVAKLLSTDEMSVLMMIEHGKFPPIEKRLITLTQVAAWLGVAERTIYDWMKTQDFPQPVILSSTPEDFRATKRWYYEEVNRWLNGRPRGVGKTAPK